MTSNLGSEHILENNDREKVMNELRANFKPEFLNRIDEIVIFNALNKDVIKEILTKIIKDLEARLKDKRITLKLTDEAANFIIDHSYNEAYGARPIKRYVTEKLETLIAKKLLSGELKEGTTLEIKVDQNELTI